MPFITQGKTNWKFLLIIIIFAVIVGGGIFGYQWWSAKKEIKTLEKTKAEAFTWKTYIDEENGYEVKRPDNWRMEVIKKAYETAILQGSVRWYPPWVPRGKIDTVIEVNIVKKQEGYSTSMILFGEEITCENVEIGDLIFCKLVKKPEKANVMDIISYSLSKNDKIYTIAIYYDLPETEIQPEFEIFNQMLSTFRFSE